MTVVAQPHQQGLQTYAQVLTRHYALWPRGSVNLTAMDTLTTVVDIQPLWGALPVVLLAAVALGLVYDKLMTTTDRTFLGS